jgi:hypothetical protein
MQVNQNYGAVTAASLARSQAYWAAVKAAMDAKAGKAGK